MKKIFVIYVVAICFILATAVLSMAEKGGKGRGSVVSKAVHQAQEEGLKGEDLAARAHEAIEERKESKEEDAVEDTGAKKARKHRYHKKVRGRQMKAKEKQN